MPACLLGTQTSTSFNGFVDNPTSAFLYRENSVHSPLWIEWTMANRLSIVIEQLTAAKTIAEKHGRNPMLCYLLDLAIVEAEEQRDRRVPDDSRSNNCAS